MDAAWWTGGGEDSWYESQFDGGGTSIVRTALNDLWDSYRIFVDWIYQRSFHYGGSHDLLNGGYFYILNTADDQITRAADTMMVNGQPLLPEPVNEGEAQEFNGQPTRYLLPMTNTDTGNYPQGFNVIFTSTPAGDTSNWGPFHMYHYQPWAWHGRPAEVVASMILRLGIGEDWLDTDSFDDAYDGEVDDTGGSTIYAPYVYVARDFGRPVGELVKEVVRHSHDMIGFTMDGKLMMASRTRPTYITSLEGVISVENRYAKEHICNAVRFTYGQVSRVTVDDRGQAPTQESSGDEVRNSDYVSQAAWEAGAQSQQSDNWTVTRTDATSISTYGEIPLGGQRAEVDESGNTTTIPPTHFRLFGGSGSAEGLATRIDLEADLLREVTVVQDLRGLDYDVGYVLGAADLTGDGDTITYMRCIKKTIDFNRMTVTSVFLETSVSEFTV